MAKLNDLQKFAEDADLVVQRLAWLTQLAVLRDIIPGCALVPRPRRGAPRERDKWTLTAGDAGKALRGIRSFQLPRPHVERG